VLVVCHRGVIRLALAALGDESAGAQEVGNATIVTLPERADGA
jgi:broad specificity phosphatase PhoE